MKNNNNPKPTPRPVIQPMLMYVRNASGRKGEVVEVDVKVVGKELIYIYTKVKQ